MRVLVSLLLAILTPLATGQSLERSERTPASATTAAPSNEETELQAQSVKHLQDDNHVEFIRVKQRLLPLEESRYGPTSPQVAATLELLAHGYTMIGREDMAAPLLARAQAIQRAPGYAPLYTEDEAASLNSGVYQRLLAREYATAEAMMRRALALLETAPDTRARERITSRIYLGDALQGQGRFPEAEAEYTWAAQAASGLQPPDAESRIFIEMRLFGLYAAQGREQDADRKIAEAAVLIAAQNRPPRWEESDQFSDYYRQRNQYKPALDWKLRTMQALYKKYALPEADAWGVQIAKQRADRWHFTDFLSLSSQGFEHVRTDPRLMGATFEVAQLAQASDVGLSIARMAARRAAAGDDFAGLLRAQQDARAALAQDEQNLGAMLGAPVRDAAAIGHLRERIALGEASVAARAREMQARFPRANALVSQAPLAPAQVEPLLHKGEALVVYVVERYTTYAWVLNKDTGQIGYVTLPLDREALERDIAAFRAKLTSGETGWGLQAMTPGDGGPLYQALVRPLQPWLQGVDRILLVVDGPLQGLPFAALGNGDEKAPDWLGRRHAFSTLPSVASLRALRGIAAQRSTELSFAGFGDPVLADIAGTTKGVAMRSLYRSAPDAGAGSRLVDPAILREVPSLPDTAVELRAIARLLDAPANAIHLRERATETAVKEAPLERYRILSFATHGVMAGELADGVEPGLILTPPSAPTTLDDGYLSASEAAQLGLDADWVLLSACNTAASDGTPGAEGLSGLANAFIYAGARALLVSHWRVSSEATTKLVAETIAAYAKSPQAGKAAALQAAMGATMAKPEYAHPYFWAAFSVIGD